MSVLAQSVSTPDMEGQPSTRFKVVKIDQRSTGCKSKPGEDGGIRELRLMANGQKSMTYKRGRWTITDFYDPPILPSTAIPAPITIISNPPSNSNSTPSTPTPHHPLRGGVAADFGDRAGSPPPLVEINPFSFNQPKSPTPPVTDISENPIPRSSSPNVVSDQTQPATTTPKSVTPQPQLVQHAEEHTMHPESTEWLTTKEVTPGPRDVLPEGLREVSSATPTSSVSPDVAIMSSSKSGNSGTTTSPASPAEIGGGTDLTTLTTRLHQPTPVRPSLAGLDVQIIQDRLGVKAAEIVAAVTSSSSSMPVVPPTEVAGVLQEHDVVQVLNAHPPVHHERHSTIAEPTSGYATPASIHSATGAGPSVMPYVVSSIAIDNKIEQAMDLVKTHLMYAVREEVEVLKDKIVGLLERIQALETENAILKSSHPQMIPQLGQMMSGSATLLPSPSSEMPPTDILLAGTEAGGSSSPVTTSSGPSPSNNMSVAEPDAK